MALGVMPVILRSLSVLPLVNPLKLLLFSLFLITWYLCPTVCLTLGASGVGFIHIAVCDWAQTHIDSLYTVTCTSRNRDELVKP